MSYEVFFSLSTGLARTLHVPEGSKASIVEHIEGIERVLGLKRTKYLDNPAHWDNFDAKRLGFPAVEEKLLCRTVQGHNRWVRMWYDRLAHWSEHPFRRGRGHKAKYIIDRHYPVGHPSEKITPKESQDFWFGFEQLRVEPDRWTIDYYRDRMEHLYEVMRGRPNEGVTFDAKALTPRQAGQVMILFSEFLDPHDIRLDVPNNRDFLASSYDGGYTWCEKCGPVAEGDEDSCNRRKCPIREEREHLS